MPLTSEFQSFDHERAQKYLHTAKKMPFTLCGSARSCKAILDGDLWYPAPYTDDGKTPDQNGVDVIVYPIMQDNSVINMIAFQPVIRPLQLYMRNGGSNLDKLLDFISLMGA